MILNTEITVPSRETTAHHDKIGCDLAKIETCEFIKWCRKYPLSVSEPQWFAMVTNLAHLEGGPKLIHEISRLDMFRYDYQQTQRLIERVQSRGYSPANCKTLRDNGFHCSKFGCCQVTMCPGPKEKSIPNNGENERLVVSLKTLADMLDAHRSSVRRWLQEDGIRPIILGRGRNGAIRYRWRDINEWLKSREHTE